MTKKKSPEVEKLYVGECVSSMDRPNLLVPLEADDEHPNAFFPLLSIRHDEEGEQQGLFFDPLHGPNWWQWNDRAPTWMDPHVFVELAMEHPHVIPCLEACFKRNSPTPAERDMPEMLDQVMEEYLEYMLDMFEQAKPYIIDWLVRRHCYKKTDPCLAVKKKKRVSRDPPE